MAISTSSSAPPKNLSSPSAGLTRTVLSLLLLAGSLFVIWWGFLLLRDLSGQQPRPPQLLVAAIAIVWGVGGMALLFTAANLFVESLPARLTRMLQPWVFVGPGMLMLIWALALPTVRTFLISLNDNAGSFIGLQNYLTVFTDPAMLLVFRNNLLWMVFGTAFTVSMGLLIAVLADRSRFETIAKALIFLPMAISFVGAGVIWKFVYDYNDGALAQIGLLNAFWTGLGGAPISWLTGAPLNTFLLIVIVLWLQTGYCMVLFSAAIKGIPAELLEAARVDGANEFQIFFGIMVPQLMGTIITVTTTIVIFTLKIFDVVIVMTGGNFDTRVIAYEFYRQYATAGQPGIAGAIAIVLLIAVIPVMVYNLRQFARQEAF
jgi:alpha-glucoside transport system permease protein